MPGDGYQLEKSKFGPRVRQKWMKAIDSHNRESLKAAKGRSVNGVLKNPWGLHAERAFLAKRPGGEQTLKRTGLCW